MKSKPCMHKGIISSMALKCFSRQPSPLSIYTTDCVITKSQCNMQSLIFFFVLQCHRNVCNWTPKLNCLGYFGVFCRNMSHFVNFLSAWIKMCKNCSNVSLFCWHRIIWILSLRGILAGSLNVPLHFTLRFSEAYWWAPANRFNFTSYVRSSSVVALSQLVMLFWPSYNICNKGKFYKWSNACKKTPHSIYLLQYMRLTSKNR